MQSIHSIYTSLGHTFKYGKAEFGKEVVDPDRKWMLQFTSGDQGLFYHLLHNKLISGNRIKVLDGGFNGIIEGLSLLEEGKVRTRSCRDSRISADGSLILKVSGEKVALVL
jgi:hypothetical protein